MTPVEIGYWILRYVHVLGAAVLLGTGAGIAFFMLRAHMTGNPVIVAGVARIVVVADFLFTATAVVVQPITGAALAREPASVQERWFAMLYVLKPVIFAVLVLFWVLTGLVSLGPGWEPGREYLLAGGVPAALASAGVIAGALADILVGIGIASRRTARHALYAAFWLSLFYMAAGTLILPELWSDPVGPMLKIWPAMALVLVALAILTDR